VENKAIDLSLYRMQNAKDTLNVASVCLEQKFYKDTINRCYYAAFYAVKAVLALEEVDFKRHKDAVAYFNKTYVATEIFSKEIGKRLGRLKQERESNDYDDFYMASVNDAVEQFETAKMIVAAVEGYLAEKGIKSNVE
jgi:uncharacterized protein (UPF0332 family)